TGNTVIAPSGLVAVESSATLDTSSFTWDKNHYYRTGDLWSAFEVAQGDKRKGYEFTEWREATGFDATSTFERKPSGVRVFVRPNRYEPGRAHVVVYNWDRADTVEID